MIRYIRNNYIYILQNNSNNMNQRKKSESSQQRYNKTMDNFKKVGTNINATLRDSNIKAEYDTWSWYYSELSNIRTECSKLGLLVRINNKSSPGYLNVYHAHIYSFLQMVITVLPENVSDKIKELWLQTKDDINEFFSNKELSGLDLKIPQELITTLDFLYDIALKIAQEAGLGFKITLSERTIDSLSKRILGE